MIYCSTQSIYRMKIQWDIFDTWQLFWINLRENNWQEMLMRYFATGGRRILCSSDALARNINRSQKRPDRNCIGAGPWSDMTDYVTPLQGDSDTKSISQECAECDAIHHNEASASWVWYQHRRRWPSLDRGTCLISSGKFNVLDCGRLIYYWH